MVVAVGSCWVEEQRRACSISHETTEGGIGQREGSLAVKGRAPGVARSSPRSEPARPVAQPAAPAHSPIVRGPSRGRDPAGGDTAPGAAVAWNPEGAPGRRRPLARPLCPGWPHSAILGTLVAPGGSGDPPGRRPRRAPFSGTRRLGSRGPAREPRVGLSVLRLAPRKFKYASLSQSPRLGSSGRGSE